MNKLLVLDGPMRGQEFPIEIATPNQVKTVAVIRCSSTTHAFNPDQRYVELVIDHTKTTISSLTVSGPPAPEYAPPGYYLLFGPNRVVFGPILDMVAA